MQGREGHDAPGPLRIVGGQVTCVRPGYALGCQALGFALPPPTQPSLGTLIRVGQDFLFSGEWWIVFFPGLTLLLLALAVNLLGDWLRDALNPRLRR